MIAFASKCWKDDWQKLIFGGFEKKEKALKHQFDGHIYIYNNGVPANFVGNHIEDIEQEVKDFFLLDDMNVYASGELAALYLAQEYEYLCYIQGDCITEGGDWVGSAIRILEKFPEIMVVSPESEVNTWHDDRGLDHYMSDQAFIVRVEDFINPEVYHVPGIDPDYPDYGGNSFEAMVGKYLKKTGKFRKILGDYYIQHPTY